MTRRTNSFERWLADAENLQELCDTISANPALVLRNLIPYLQERGYVIVEGEKRKEDAKKDSYEEEKMRWIEQHGSKRLRAIVAAGYSGDRLYKDERDRHAFRKLGRYVVNRNNVRDERCDSPSLKALKLEKRIKTLFPYMEPSIVWLPEMVVEDWVWEPREAVRVYPPWRDCAVYIFP